MYSTEYSAAALIFVGGSVLTTKLYLHRATNFIMERIITRPASFELWVATQSKFLGVAETDKFIADMENVWSPIERELSHMCMFNHE